MVEGHVVAGWTLLGVGALLIVVAIVLIVYLIHRRRKFRKGKRPYSPDTFKIVYKVPPENGSITKIAPDMLDSRSVHTLRSEPGYKYVVPSVERASNPPIIVSPASVVAAPPSVISVPQTLPRASSVDHVTVTLPRTGQRFIVPAPNGTLPKILVPVDKKKARRMKKGHYSRPAYTLDNRSVLSVPSYATTGRPHTQRSVSKEKYYVYGSTPNLAASHYTQPVLMYDKNKHKLFADDMAGGNTHVRNWLSDDQPTSFSGDDTDVIRPRSRASSAPTDLEQLNAEVLHMRWSPSMRRRVEEMDRQEVEDRFRLNQQQNHLHQEVLAPDGKRYQPLHHYTELSEEF